MPESRCRGLGQGWRCGIRDNCVAGVRYCGGCNPRYDRAALVHSLEVSFPEVPFEPFRPESDYIAVLAVCGCPAQCALRAAVRRHCSVPGPELPCFTGHFPGDPVLPRVYTVEAAAQAADILMVTAGRYAGKLPLFMGIERARFRQKILPGDTLEIHVALQEELEKRAIAACRGEVYAGSLLAAELEIRLAFRRGGERNIHLHTGGELSADLPRPPSAISREWKAAGKE